jgi:alpha-mannosidase
VAGSAPAVREALAPALSAPAHAGAHVASAVGHAHIDSAWLWPLRETVRKVARTIANVTALMDEQA